MLEYRILGPLQILRDGVEVALSAPKVKAVALVLLLNPNEVISADVLVDALWGDHPPDSARKLVQVYVSQLRAGLGADAIQTVGQGYRIRVAPMGLDAARFDRMRRDGRAALNAGNAELGLALSRRALGLWHGTRARQGSPAPRTSHPESGSGLGRHSRRGGDRTGAGAGAEFDVDRAPGGA